MNENCPQCGSQDTKSLIGVYAYYPPGTAVATFALALFSLLFINGYKALFICAAILIAGHYVRKHYLAKQKSFQCNQCQNTFLPGSPQQQNASAPQQTPKF
jgi:hypothetical protein